MFNSVALDVTIGLIFVYLLYSLLASILQEIISTNLAFRSKILEKGIVRMLEKDKGCKYIVLDRIRSYWMLLFRSDQLRNNKFAAAFYSHPLIKYLGEDNFHSKPSYLNAQNFSKVMVDLLHGIDSDMRGYNILRVKESILSGTLRFKDGNNTLHTADAGGETEISSETRMFLLSLLSEAQGDIDRFKLLLEKWFDDTMDRTSGWYKKYTQVVLFVIGMTIAIGFNLDTISMVRKLSSDPKLREQVVQSAGTFMEKNQQLQGKMEQMRAGNQQNTPAYANMSRLSDSIYVMNMSLLKSADSLLKNDINDLNQLMGLGWEKGFMNFKANRMNGTAIIGWFITALAISLGAPFWFDLLNKLMKLRGAAKNDPSSTSAAAPGTSQNPITFTVNNGSETEAVG